MLLLKAETYMLYLCHSLLPDEGFLLYLWRGKNDISVTFSRAAQVCQYSQVTVYPICFVFMELLTKIMNMEKVVRVKYSKQHKENRKA